MMQAKERKRTINEGSYTQNITKNKRNNGEQYTIRKSKLPSAKTLEKKFLLLLKKIFRSRRIS